MSEEKPLYTHDCTACRFLGRHTYDAPLIEGTRETTVDLYVCPGSTSPDAIARHGDEGREYASLPIFAMWRWPLTKGMSTYGAALPEVLRRLDLPRVLGRIARGHDGLAVLDVAHNPSEGLLGDAENYRLFLDDGKELTVMEDDGEILVFGGRIKPLFTGVDAQHIWTEAAHLLTEAQQRNEKAIRASKEKS